MGNTPVRLGMIWAEAGGHAIGRAGDMPWHLPEDLAHFKRTTLGAPVIMGRRTWESLPERVRPLPGRANFVVTRDPEYAAPGAEVVASLDEALARLTPAAAADQAVAAHSAVAAASDEAAGSAPVTAWITGGGELYRAALSAAAELVVTRIALDIPDADTFAPEIGPEWTLVDPGAPLHSASGVDYRIERWIRA